ncbi:MAG: sulfotransferase family protein [Egibacteraceae bacterium]
MSEGAGRAKVFGIGLSKTGTKSLSKALSQLGLRTIHFPLVRNNVLRAAYDLPVLREYDAATDLPVAALFPHLDVRYPGSKFILTVREKEPWLRSCERYYASADAIWEREGALDRALFWRLLVFGCHRFNRERFAYVYDRHVREAFHHFQRRRRDLLVMDVCGGDGWEALCPFLECEEPNRPFPWEHRTDSVNSQLRRRR